MQKGFRQNYFRLIRRRCVTFQLVSFVASCYNYAVIKITNDEKQAGRVSASAFLGDVGTSGRPPRLRGGGDVPISARYEKNFCLKLKFSVTAQAAFKYQLAGADRESQRSYKGNDVHADAVGEGVWRQSSARESAD